MLQENLIIHQLQGHYSPPNLSDRILAALTAAGKDLDHLTLEDLAPLDAFHIRGQQATVELAARLDLKGSEKILDAGSGLGGAARYLAATYGSQATGLDITEEYVLTAQMLSDRLDLSDRLTFKQGSALDMPFEDETFDVVWTQHAQMNIQDKPRLYQEIYRVLKPGGRFAMYDILAGEGGPALFPVPWTRIPDYSFLIRPDDLRLLLEQTGFTNLHWQNLTESSYIAFRDMVLKARQNGGAPPLGFHVFLGPEFRAMADNVVQNLADGRIAVIEAIWRKG